MHLPVMMGAFRVAPVERTHVPVQETWVRSLGRGGGHGNPLQSSCLESPMDRGARQLQSTGHRESDTTGGLN